MPLAGILEKCSRWKREWSPRFFILRGDRIDYYLEPPDDFDEDEPRGTLSLSLASPAEEIGRPCCIQVGSVLLSCACPEEQRRWIESINDVYGACTPATAYPSNAAAARRRSTSSNCSFDSEETARLARQVSGPAAFEPAEASLVLLIGHADGARSEVRPLRWRETVNCSLPTGENCAHVLLMDSAGGTQGICRVPLQQSRTSCCVIQRFSKASRNLEGALEVVVQSCEKSGVAPHNLFLYAYSCLALAAAMAYASASYVVAISVTVSAVLFALDAHGRCSTVAKHTRDQATISVVRYVQSYAANPTPTPTHAVRLVSSTSAPLWVGRWLLDKSRSEPYEPILLDMGMNFILRRAIDAKTSVLVLSVGTTHMVINVKTLVTVEDTLPLDCSWVTKPAPPATKHKGNMRMRLLRHSSHEIVLSTELPNGAGELRDTTTVHADGAWFSRKTEKFGPAQNTADIVVHRVFRRVP